MPTISAANRQIFPKFVEEIINQRDQGNFYSFNNSNVYPFYLYNDRVYKTYPTVDLVFSAMRPHVTVFWSLGDNHLPIEVLAPESGRNYLVSIPIFLDFLQNTKLTMKDFNIERVYSQARCVISYNPSSGYPLHHVQDESHTQGSNLHFQSPLTGINIFLPTDKTIINSGSVEGGLPPYSYRWLNSQNIPVSSKSDVTWSVDNPPASFIVRLDVTDSAGTKVSKFFLNRLSTDASYITRPLTSDKSTYKAGETIHLDYDAGGVGIGHCTLDGLPADAKTDGTGSLNAKNFTTQTPGTYKITGSYLTTSGDPKQLNLNAITITVTK